MIIDQINLRQVIDLLRSGFPSRSRTFWKTGLERLLTSPAHATGEVPIGYVLTSGRNVVGVGLTAQTPTWFTALNQAKGEPRINLASWYVEPDHRWRVPLLLRRMMRNQTATYTDLTATEHVYPLLKTLGFRLANSGVFVFNLAIAALRPSDEVFVTGFKATEHDDMLQRAVADHEGYGCLSFQLNGPAGSSPLLLKPRPMRKVPVVEVIYCEDNRQLQAGLPSLARKLLKAGHMGLILEIPEGHAPATNLSQIVLTKNRRRFVKNALRTVGTDYTYSELVYFDF